MVHSDAESSEKPKAEGDDDDDASDAEECEPACMKDHGYCHDQICWCRDPWAGSTCQRERVPDPRVGYSLAIGMLCAAVAAGVTAAVFISQMVAALQVESFGKQAMRKESWVPAGRH